MTTSTDTSVPSVTSVASVVDGRALLDDIDAQLMHLLSERRAVSKQVQHLRVQDGGSRVEHSRENAIIRRWAETLGDGGADLALAVLAHCRGRL
jgi:chorismate mutase